MDDDRAVRRCDAPLSEEQRSFADEHHGLLISFMAKYHLDADCYDRLALRYLHAVARYTTEESLQQYAFSTILWYHLRSELSNILRDNRRQPEETEIDGVPSRELDYDHVIDAVLWKQIEQTLTFKQCEAVYLRNQGYKNKEIAEMCGVRPKAIEKRFSRIRKKLKNEENLL